MLYSICYSFLTLKCTIEMSYSWFSSLIRSVSSTVSNSTWNNIIRCMLLCAELETELAELERILLFPPLPLLLPFPPTPLPSHALSPLPFSSLPLLVLLDLTSCFSHIPRAQFLITCPSFQYFKWHLFLGDEILHKNDTTKEQKIQTFLPCYLFLLSVSVPSPLSFDCFDMHEPS